MSRSPQEVQKNSFSPEGLLQWFITVSCMTFCAFSAFYCPTVEPSKKTSNEKVWVRFLRGIEVTVIQLTVLSPLILCCPPPAIIWTTKLSSFSLGTLSVWSVSSLMNSSVRGPSVTFPLFLQGRSNSRPELVITGYLRTQLKARRERSILPLFYLLMKLPKISSGMPSTNFLKISSNWPAQGTPLLGSLYRPVKFMIVIQSTPANSTFTWVRDKNKSSPSREESSFSAISLVHLWNSFKIVLKDYLEKGLDLCIEKDQG